jgi:hypothetical protein
MHDSSKLIKSTSIQEIGNGNSIHIQSRTKVEKKTQSSKDFGIEVRPIKKL